jgi:hypothetical protein
MNRVGRGRVGADMLAGELQDIFDEPKLLGLRRFVEPPVKV